MSLFASKIRQTFLSNLKGQVSTPDETLESLIEKGYEVYDEKGLALFLTALQSTGDEDLIKGGKKDLNKLVQKTITVQRNGKSIQKRVWVKPGEDVSAQYQPKQDQNTGQKQHNSSQEIPKYIKIGAKTTGGYDEIEENPAWHEAVKKEAQKLVGRATHYGLVDSQSKKEDNPSKDNGGNAIQDIVKNPNMKKSDKVRALLDHGISDKKQLATLSGAHYSQVLTIASNYTPGESKGKGAMSEQQLEQAINSAPMPSVEDRWDAYDMFAEMVVTGSSKSLIAFGTGGVGKTYTVNQQLKQAGMVLYDPDAGHELGADDYDAVKITGKASASAIYQAMFEHNGKLIMFDDCDSALKDEDAVNLFKGALDTSGDGTIAYGGGKGGRMKTEAKHGIPVDKKGNRIPDPEKGGDEDEDGEMEKRVIPNRFKFNGQVIFISNLTPKQMPQPLVDSRSLAVDLTMTVDQTIERMRMIVGKMPIEDAKGNAMEVSQDDRTAVVDFLEEHKNNIREGKLNARTIGNIAKIKINADAQGRDWKKQATVMLYS